MSTRRYHHGDLRRALLDAAQALVAESGLSAVTMSAVARRAEVSSGAPYRHFEDRAALLRALSDRARQILGSCMRRASAGAPDALEGFRRAGVAYVRFAADEPALFHTLARSEYADGADPADPFGAGFNEALGALLRSGDAQTPLDPRHPVLQQLAARSMMHGLAHFFADGQHEALGIGTEQAQRLADALTRALGAPSLEPPR